jgi:enoyl-CoA hydratase/carnithine racemase
MNALPEFATLSVDLDCRTATVTIDHPPLNLLDVAMLADLDRLGCWLGSDEELNVVVFRSANPRFFIAHADLSMLDAMPRSAESRSSAPSVHQLIVDRFRTLPQVTIGLIEGIARGGGSEFLMALDMRFGELGKAILSQPEVALGFPPGCGGTQRLPRLVGRSNALEAILGCADYSAQDAARIGWLNRAMPHEELIFFVERLVARIASFSRSAIMAAKSAVDSSTKPLRDGFCDESDAFLRAYAAQDTQNRVRRAIQRGFQTGELEAGSIDDWLQSLGDSCAASDSASTENV